MAEKAKGVGWMEAPRGALGHWIEIEDGKRKLSSGCSDDVECFTA